MLKIIMQIFPLFQLVKNGQDFNDIQYNVWCGSRPVFGENKQTRLFGPTVQTIVWKWASACSEKKDKISWAYSTNNFDAVGLCLERVWPAGWRCRSSSCSPATPWPSPMAGR